MSLDSASPADKSAADNQRSQRSSAEGAEGAEGAEAILSRLAEVLAARKQADPNTSYVAKLYAKGLDAILKKIGEEATETVLAAKDGEIEAIVHEVADLWFHTMVLLNYHDAAPQAVLDELARRFGIGGLVEKAGRDN